MTNENVSLKIRKSKKLGWESFWVVDVIEDGDRATGYIRQNGTRGEYVDYPTKLDALDAARLSGLLVQDDLETSAGEESTTKETKIRKFETGATRDNIEGKLDYMKALSPIVLRRYVQYLDKHRLQPDGSMRDFDNWKKGIPLETYHSSKGRHFFAAWLLEEDYEVEDNHGPVTEEDALCGELFNTIGRLHELLKARLKPTEK